jgi:hypothetical protein
MSLSPAYSIELDPVSKQHKTKTNQKKKNQTRKLCCLSLYNMHHSLQSLKTVSHFLYSSYIFYIVTVPLSSPCLLSPSLGHTHPLSPHVFQHSLSLYNFEEASLCSPRWVSCPSVFCEHQSYGTNFTLYGECI